MESDPKRLQQILKNLLSNAVKFTSHGHVEVNVAMASGDGARITAVLSTAPQVVAFTVEDTGIGVPPDKQRLIFEAFQQADAGTLAQVRRHGPRSGDQPGAGDASRRRDQAHQHTTAREASSRCTCRFATPARPRRGRRRAPATARRWKRATR
jgi:hypothetical protein